MRKNVSTMKIEPIDSSSISKQSENSRDYIDRLAIVMLIKLNELIKAHNEREEQEDSWI